MRAKLEALRSNRLLRHLSEDDRQALAPHLALVELPRGEILFDLNIPISAVYFFLTGSASIIMIMENGRAIEAAAVGRDGALGLIAGASGTRRPFRRGVVQIPGTALKIESQQLRRLVDERPGIRDMALRYAEVMLFMMLQSAACNALHPVEARLSRWLLMCHDRLDGAPMHITHDYLADVLGVHRPAVTLALHKLRHAGLETGRGRITVRDPTRLKAASCECYRFIRMQEDEMLDHGATS